MIKNDVTTAIVLETRTPRKDNTFPVKLRVTHKRIRKYYGLKEYLTQEEFDRVYSSKPRGKEKELQLRFTEVETKAKDVIKDLTEFSFSLFEKYLFEEKVEKGDVFAAYENYIKKLTDNQQFGTLQTYQLSLKMLKAFVDKRTLTFNEITPEFLLKLEKWCLNNNKSNTTIGIYVRCLRTLVNEAVANSTIKREQYPFGRNKYQIPSSRNIKKALKINEIEKILTFEVKKGTTEEFSRDIWIFSYLTNGMNIADIGRLRYKDIHNDMLVFIREKTKRTTKHNSKPIKALISPESKIIIERWGNKPQEPEKYVFPIIKNLESAEKQHAEIKQAVKTINKYMKRIALKLDINANLTTYVARHSFSDILKQSGASKEFIGECLGHLNLATTENYLDSFEDNLMREQLSKLTNFKK